MKKTETNKEISILKSYSKGTIKKNIAKDLPRLNALGIHTKYMHQLGKKLGWYCGCGFYSPKRKEVINHIKEKGNH